MVSAQLQPRTMAAQADMPIVCFEGLPLFKGEYAHRTLFPRAATLLVYSFAFGIGATPLNSVGNALLSVGKVVAAILYVLLFPVFSVPTGHVSTLPFFILVTPFTCSRPMFHKVLSAPLSAPFYYLLRMPLAEALATQFRTRLTFRLDIATAATCWGIVRQWLPLTATSTSLALKRQSKLDRVYNSHAVISTKGVRHPQVVSSGAGDFSYLTTLYHR